MMIFKKSNDPVNIKRIAVRVWALRDEIESALYRRIQQCEAMQVPLYVEDIKEFYSLKKNIPLADNNVLQLSPTEEAEATPVAATEEMPTEDSIQKADSIIQAQEKMKEDLTSKIPEIFKQPFERQAPDLEKISYGFSLLSDMNMQSILIFSKNSFLAGQSVVIDFLIPNHFMQSAQVVKCIHYGIKSRIISETKPDYRLQCTFKFDYSGERQLLRDFLLSVEPDKVNTPKNNSSSEETSL